MIILSAFFFACMNVSVRLAGDLPSVEKSFFRNLVAAVFAAVILCKNRTVPKVDKKYWGFCVTFTQLIIFWWQMHRF